MNTKRIWISTCGAMLALSGAGTGQSPSTPAVVAPAESKKDDSKRDSFWKKDATKRDDGRETVQRAPDDTVRVEELIAQAIRSHPELIVEQAKVAAAEAQLKQTRQRIISQIAVAAAEYEYLSKTALEAESRHATAKGLLDRKAIPKEEYRMAELTAEKFRLDSVRALAQLYQAAGVGPARKSLDLSVPRGGASLPTTPAFPIVSYPAMNTNPAVTYIPLPSGPPGTPVFPSAVPSVDPGSFRSPVTMPSPQVTPGSAPASLNPPRYTGGAGAAVHPSTIEKVRKALQKEITPEFVDVTLPDAVRSLARLSDLDMVYGKDAGPLSVESFEGRKAIPAGAAMQWIEDAWDVRFVVRDYGIRVTPTKRMPPDAILALDVWRGKSLVPGIPTADPLSPIPSSSLIPPTAPLGPLPTPSAAPSNPGVRPPRVPAPQIPSAYDPGDPIPSPRPEVPAPTSSPTNRPNTAPVPNVAPPPVSRKTPAGKASPVPPGDAPTIAPPPAPTVEPSVVPPPPAKAVSTKKAPTPER